MTGITALVLPPRHSRLDHTMVGGLTLLERAVRALHRAGVDNIVLSAERFDDAALPGRLAASGIGMAVAGQDEFGVVPPGHALLVVTADVVFEPKVIARLVESAAGDEAHVRCASAARHGVLAYAPPAMADALRRAPSVRRALFELRRGGAVAFVDVGPLFCRPVPLACDGVWPLERDCIRAGNGVEGVFTRAIRVVSVPVSGLLLRLHVSPNQVTLLGLALSVLAALQFSHRAYWPGVIGALYYYASTVLDCSDGEVARASFADSKVGAWLETVCDYLSYFLVLGGLVGGEIQRHGICPHVDASIVAAAASLAIVLIVGRLRHEVAAANPGAFDDALSTTLVDGSQAEQFAVATRALIKRSFLAHLIVFQALIGHLPALLYVWACGSVAALTTLLAVKGAVARRVKVAPIRGVVPVVRKEI